MKLSKFNVNIQELDDGSKLIFNSISTTFVKLNKTYIEIMNNIETFSSDEITDIYKKEIDDLKRVGIVIEDDFDELTFLNINKQKSKFTDKKFNLVIAPTINCNMKCPYCYEDKSTDKMDVEVINKVFEYVKNQYDILKYETLSVVWYGGEPLLEIKVIEKLSKMFIEFCSEKNVSYFASIITNGLLLNKENAKILKECMVQSAQITLDGYKEVHNLCRPTRSGKGSFDEIVNNVDDVYNLINIVIRINVSKNNYKEVKVLLDFILDKKWHERNINFYLAPVTNCQEACNLDVSQVLSMDEFSKIESEYLDYLIDNNVIKVLSNKYPQYTPIGCMAECLNSYIIDPNGDLYKCTQEIGIKEKVVGDIFTGLKMNKESFNYLFSQEPLECNECNLLPICHGGCVTQRFKNGNKPYCYTNKATIKNNLFKMYKLWNRSKNECI